MSEMQINQFCGNEIIATLFSNVKIYYMQV